MFDIGTFPKVNIKEVEYNDISIKLLPNRPKTYALFNKGARWCFYDAYTNHELKEMYSSYDLAHGKVLISGFGFGLLASWLASKPEVESVTVIEYSKDIYDVFLQNNTLPEKVKVIICDASEYKTDEFFDCILLDHYEQETTDWVFKDIKKISKNVPNHNLIWAWSLEEKYVQTVFNISSFDLSKTLLWEQYFDFYSRYEHFKKNVLSIPTLPKFKKNKLNEYILTYFDRIGYSTEL
jgi:hypothetical protein